MKTGYFQFLWLWIWNNLIKNSLIYKILCKVYGFFSYKWQASKITGWFRRVDGDVEKHSVFGRIFGCGFSLIEKISKKSEFFTKCKENSFIVSACKYLLHNFLALNLRFIGILSAAGLAVYTGLNAFSGNDLSPVALALMLISAILAVFNVNAMDYFKPSGISKLAEYLIGTEFTYKAYYMTKCSKSRARYVCAVFFGVLAGVIGAKVNPLIGVGAVLGIVFFSMVMYKVEFGVFITVILAPFIPTMALAGMVIICAFSLLVKAITGKNFKWSFGIVGMFIIFMIGIYLVSALTSFARGKSLQIWAIYAVMMCFFFVVINTIKTKKQLLDLCRAFVLSGLFVCLYGIYQYVFQVADPNAWLDESMFEGISMRIYSTLENPNVLGEYILLLIPVSVALMWKTEKVASKIFYFAVTAVMAAALILTFSRGCWIAIMVAAAIYITFVCGKIWGLLLLVIPVLPFVIPETVIQRFASVGDMSDSSTSYRVYIWAGTFLMLKDFWISGIGMGEEAFNRIYPFYSYNAIVAPHSHNMFFQVLVETGISGMINFMLILLFWFKQICRGHKVTQDKTLKTVLVAIGAAVFAFLVQGMFDNCFYNYRVFMLFWFVLGLGIAAVNIAKKEDLTDGKEN